jgi:acyl carrier protein
MQHKPEIRQFVIDNFLYGQDDATLTDDVSFLEKGIIDSTGVLELVSFIEETYGFSVGDEEIIPDNFDSLSKLANFVVKKKSAVGETFQKV